MAGLAVSRQFESGMRLDLGGYTVRIPLVFVDENEVVGFRFVSTEPLGTITVDADGGIHSSGSVIVGKYANGRHVGTVFFPGAAKRDDQPGIHEIRLTTCLPPSSGPTTPRDTPTDTPEITQGPSADGSTPAGKEKPTPSPDAETSTATTATRTETPIVTPAPTKTPSVTPSPVHSPAPTTGSE
jgi:hypothetical protein